MKIKIIALGLLFAVTTAFTQTNTIRLHLENPESQEVLIAYYMGDKQYILGKEGASPSAPKDEMGNQLAILDGAGNGSFTYDGMKPGIYLVVFKPNNNYMEFIFEGKDLDLYAKDGKLIDHPGNSNSNRIKAQHDNFQSRRAKLQEENPADIQQKMESLTNEYFAFLEENRAKYPNNVFLKILKAAENPDVPEIEDENKRFYAYRDRYFDKMDFSADWLLRTPLFNSKVTTYFERLTSKVPDSIIEAIDRVATLTESNEELYKYFVIDRLNTYAKSKIMGHDKIYHHMAMNYYEKGKATWAEETQLQKILTRAKEMEGTFVGDKAANISATSTTGQNLSLYDIDSKYTMLFLMDPYCGHCKDASNKIIELKDQFPTDLRIFGVVFNATMDEMKKIKGERNYYWPCVVPSVEDQIVLRDAYNVLTYPQIFLLDSNKEIIAKQISVEQVLEIVKSLN